MSRLMRSARVACAGSDPRRASASRAEADDDDLHAMAGLRPSRLIRGGAPQETHEQQDVGRVEAAPDAPVGHARVEEGRHRLGDRRVGGSLARDECCTQDWRFGFADQQAWSADCAPLGRRAI